jgi:hypothetical protein
MGMLHPWQTFHSEERLTHFLVFKAMLFVCKIKLKVGHSQNKGFITR